jgi:hypothetical protein
VTTPVEIGFLAMARQQRRDDVHQDEPDEPEDDHPAPDEVAPQELDAEIRQLVTNARDAKIHEALGFQTWTAYLRDVLHRAPDQSPTGRLAQLNELRQRWDTETTDSR